MSILNYENNYEILMIRNGRHGLSGQIAEAACKVANILIVFKTY